MLPEPYGVDRETWIDNSTNPVTVWYAVAPDYRLHRAADAYQVTGYLKGGWRAPAWDNLLYEPCHAAQKCIAASNMAALMVSRPSAEANMSSSTRFTMIPASSNTAGALVNFRTTS